jgi:hypothetical protein
LLAKVQERQGENQQVHKITTEPRDQEPKVAIITRGGNFTGEDRVTPGKTTYGLGIKRASEKLPLFDPRKENHTFEEASREFVGEHDSSSKAQLEVRECEMPP